MSGSKAATSGPEGDKNVAQLDLSYQHFNKGVYSHYKGGFYIAFAVSIQEDTLGALVHYYSMERKTRWTRTFTNFFDVVKNAGQECRFEFIRRATWQELAEAAGNEELLNGLQALAAGQRFLDEVCLKRRE